MNSFCTYKVLLNNIQKNLKTYKKIDGKSKICAVVKANAYGLGVQNVVPKIESLVDCFAVANFQEAAEVEKLTNKKIIILNFVPKDLIGACAEKSFQISVSNFAQLLWLRKCLKNQKIDVHLAVDTGMHRIGFDNTFEFEKSLKYIKKHKNISIVGIFSHIFNAKCQKDTQKQNAVFQKYLEVLSKHFDTKSITKHLLASEGAVRYPELRYDMVRLGILLYANFDGKNFCDAVELKTKIIAIKNLEKGDSVGYCKKFVAKKKTKIGVVPIGYADGVLRCTMKKGYVLYNGKFCKIVGNVCMDMFAVDLTDTNAKVGDNITLIGKSKSEQIFLSDVARWQNTICYEILTNIKQNRLNVITK